MNAANIINTCVDKLMSEQGWHKDEVEVMYFDPSDAGDVKMAGEWLTRIATDNVVLDIHVGGLSNSKAPTTITPCLR